MRQSDVPGLAFSICTHLARMPSTAPAPAAALGSLTCTWPNSDCAFDVDDAPCGRASPHATPAPTEIRVATTTRTTLRRCTGGKPSDADLPDTGMKSPAQGTVQAMDRRTFLKAAGGLGLLAFASPTRVRALLAAGPRAGQAGRYLTAHELDTLRAVAGRFIPGPPDDPDPGAVEAGA